MGELFGIKLHISLAAEEIFHIGAFKVTNSMIMMLITMAFVLIFFARTAGRAQLMPGGRLQQLGEMVVEALQNLVDTVAGRSLGRRIFPVIATLFIFILAANWMAVALLPLVGTVGVYHEDHGEKVLIPFLRPANADLNMTIAMALIAVTFIQIVGIKFHGFGGYIKELATPWFLFPVHVISELSRILSLSARLFGNIFGGEVFLVVTFFLFPLFAPLLTIGLEIFFGFIQAVLFSVLTLVYVSMAAAGHGGHGESHGHEHAHDGQHAPAHAPAGAGH
jgi:F-type H+-transporting ATPase subunit a